LLGTVIPVRLLHGTHVLPLATFFGAFAWSCIHVSLPSQGVINAAWIGASFVGPVITTSLLATGWPALLYVILALAGLACLPLSAMRAHVPAVAR
jgi:hypothetical protein